MTAYQRAELWLSKVPPAISGSGGHNATFTAAVGLVHGFGLSEGDALRLLSEWNRSCQPPWTDRELAYKIRSAASTSHDKPAGHLLNAVGTVECTDLSRVVFRKPAGSADPASSEFKRFLESAFAPTEVVCICEQVEEGKPMTSGSFLPVEEWIKRFDNPDSILFRDDRTDGVFVRINPFKPGLYSGSDNDVSAYRHVLVEFDERPKPEQEKLLRDSGLPISVMIDSGGKSIHGWVRVDAANRKEWDLRRDEIYKAIPGIDPKNKNPSRFSRLPGSWRGEAKQKLLATNLGANSWEEWLTNRETDEDQSTIVTVKDLLAFDPENDPDNLIGNRWITRGSSMIISGGTGIGKSSLMMQIIVRWCLGLDFFGIKPVKALKIGVIQAENDRGDLSEAFRGVTHRRFTIEQMNLLQKNLEFRTETVRTGEQFLAFARRFIHKSKLDLIIADPLFSYFGGDLSDQSEVSVFLRNKLQPILHETKVAWIWMHHVAKPQRKETGEPLTTMELAHSGFGSSELANWAREIAVLHEVGQSKPRRFQLAFCKRGGRLGLPSPILNLQHSATGIQWEQCNPLAFTGAELKEKKPYQPRRGQRA